MSRHKKDKSTSRQVRKSVTIRFAGDSGDGMQLAGSQFTQTSAVIGNDIATFPDFPAEIRAPAGSLPGVSAFQVHFSDHDIRTPGDELNVLVAMNPAALKVHLASLESQGIVVLNTDSFTEANLKKVGYSSNPLEDNSLDSYRSFPVPISKLTHTALADTKLSNKQKERCKNFFALGLMFWVYDRDIEPTLAWMRSKFKSQPDLLDANERVLKAGYYYGETAELFESTLYSVPRATLPKGLYRQITGNQATALGIAVSGHLSERKVFYASYPITPASDILHEVSRYKKFGVRTFQAEDEIAAVGSAIGAAFGGNLGVTASSGPGIALKAEAINLAIMAELPLIIIDVQRAGPSTGMPTKTEQTDLLQALYGRNGESPVAIVAPATGGECFDYMIEAIRLAVKYMTPVFFLSDANLANSAEPWQVPDLNKLEKIQAGPIPASDDFLVYQRHPETLARAWVSPGAQGYEHRIGGIEKQEVTGNVSYDPINHERMCRLREEKVNKIATDIPALEVDGSGSGDVLVLGWGSTYGAIASAVEALRAEGKKVSHAHLRYLNPFPANIETILKNFKQVLIPENNFGQLSMLIRARFLIDAKPLSKVQGQPFKVGEIKAAVEALL